MKWLVAILLLTNVGLALWAYGREPRPVMAPPPWHAQLLRAVPPGARPLPPVLPPAPVVPAAPPSAGAKHPTQGKSPRQVPQGQPQPTIPSQPAPVVAKTTCWQLGPVLERARALHLLRRLHIAGRVISRLGPPAYRVFLPVGVPWPTAATLARAGVRGAYVAHGPTGAEVLSLGVFLKHTAALVEARSLQSRHLPVLIAPFGAPTHYFDKVQLTGASVAFWRKLGPIGHTVCAKVR